MRDPRHEQRDHDLAPGSSGKGPSGHPEAGVGVEPSAQARVLHTLALALAEARGTGGLIGRSEAVRLSAEVGAPLAELVDSGMWIEYDVSFLVLQHTAGERPAPTRSDGTAIGSRSDSSPSAR